MTHYLSLNGTSAAEAIVIVQDGPVSPTAQALANRTGVMIIAYMEIDGSYWPDTTLGDWGSFDPRTH